MNCDEFRALLDACQENELQAAAKDHAAVCKDCALLLAIRDDCRSLDANAEAPATFSQAWRKMVREEESPLYYPRNPFPLAEMAVSRRCFCAAGRRHPGCR